MSVREVVVLGTASQVPTRYRNHNGYLLRWDGHGLLFDPGEGTQRQFTLANVAPTAVTHIFITHFHGDHCLGLPGMIQRLGIDGVSHPVTVHYPASGQIYFDRLRGAAIARELVNLRNSPVEPGVVDGAPGVRIRCARLRHGADTLGWRIDELPRRRMLPAKLEAAGIHGPDIGRLQRDGSIDVAGRRVELDEVSEYRRGQSFAFVMDTAWCDAALDLADGVDLLVIESTYQSSESSLAREYGHLTAAQAARIAAEARARRLLLTHFSQRYKDDAGFRTEAGDIFPNVVVARDFDRVPLP